MLALPPFRKLLGSASPISLSSLFANGEQGIWLDPSDRSTLFQDAAGTTPVTADGQPVGLVLDKHSWGGKSPAAMLASQTELVATGAFDNASDATAWGAQDGNISRSVVGGELQVNLAGSSTYVWYSFTSVPGAWYRLAFSGRAGASATSVKAEARNGDFGGSGAPLVTSANVVNGSSSCYFVATSTTTSIRLWVNAPSIPATGFFDDVSLKTISGNHVFQTSTPSKPTYKTDGAYHWLYHDGSDDFLTVGLLPLSPATALLWGIGTKYQNDTTREWFSNYNSNATDHGVVGLYDTGGYINAYSNGMASAHPNQSAMYASTGNTPLVMVGTSDIPGSLSTIRVNGIAGIDGTASKGTGSFTDRTFTIGRRGGVYFAMKGNIYGLVIRAGTPADPLLSQAERWMAQKTGVSW